MKTMALGEGSIKHAFTIIVWATAIIFQGMLSDAWAVEVETRTVEVTGLGSSPYSAIANGLIQALGQVGGMFIEAKEGLTNWEKTISVGKDETYISSQRFQQDIQSATRGAVKEYRILNQKKNKQGLFEVSMTVVCLKVVPDSINRKKIVCATFPLVGAVKAGIFDFSIVPPSDIFTETLEAALVQSRRFAVLDRRETDALAREKEIVVKGNLPIEDMLRICTDNSTDLIVVGSIEVVDYVVTSHTMPSGRTLSFGTGSVEIYYRVVAVASRQIKYADRFRHTYADGDLRKLANSVAINYPGRLMLADAASRIARQILEAIYPLRVIHVAGDQLTLNGGGTGVCMGQFYDVFALGTEQTDPYTREKLGRLETRVGRIKIETVTPKMAQGKIVEKLGEIAEGSLCRLSDDQTEKTEPVKGNDIEKLY